MTIEEAKEQLSELIDDRSELIDYRESFINGSDDEIYRKDIEALEKAMEILEKQIPKAPKRGVCPNCNSRHIYAASFTKADRFKYCGDCGQALDWSDNEPTKPKGRRMFSDEQLERICWEIEQVNKEQREKELKSTKEGD